MSRQEVIQAIQSLLESKLQLALDQMASLQESLGSEAKSTAGDKHETGRAMVQREMEQAEESRARAQEALDQFRSASSDEPPIVVTVGSVVETDRGIFFVGPSLGKILVGTQDVFAVSPASPIGQAMLGASAPEERSFMGKSLSILSLG